MIYEKEQLDIYIDGARHLPDNVSITKIIARVVDTNAKDLVPKIEKLADI